MATLLAALAAIIVIVASKAITVMRASTSRGQVLGPVYLNKLVLNHGSSLVAGLSTDEISVKAVGSEIAQNLMSSIRLLYAEALTGDGSKVDYTKLQSSSKYAEYTALAANLNKVQVEAFTEQDRKAFFINIYNSLVIHALIEMGTPNWLGARLARYATASYAIGNHVYSLNDIENGILRGNRRSAAPGSRKQFDDDNDERIKFIIPLDPRIHFSLNCGAVSCPPIRFYDGEKLDHQLNLATTAFINSLSLNEKTGLIEFSQIFKWYAADFGSNDKQVLQWVLPYFKSEAKQDAVEKQLLSDPVELVYEDYDWGINSK